MIGLLLLFTPLAAALLVLIGSKKPIFSAMLSLIPAAITAWAYCLFQSGHDFTVDIPWISRPNIHFRIGMDGVAFLLIALTNISTPLILLSVNKVSNSRTFCSLILLMQFALTGVFMADDAALYYVFWELTLIPAYFLLLYWGGENRGKVTFKFFVYTLMGSLFMLIAFIYLYAKGEGQLSSGNLSLLSLDGKEQAWIFAAFMLAFGIKLPLIPFHSWQADAYREAPSQGAMILSGLMAKMGLFSMVRWMIPAVPMSAALYQPVVMGLCVAGVVYGAVVAIQQTDLKRMIAYASLSHMALMTAGIFSFAKSGIEAAFVQAFAHGINTVGILACAHILQSRLNTSDLSKMGGVRRAAPKFAAVFFVLMFAMVALPLTNSFAGEIVLLYSIFEYSVWMAAPAALTLVLGAVYMLRMTRLSMLGENDATKNFADLTCTEKWMLYPIVILVFVFGLCPQPLFDLTAQTAESILKLIEGI